MDINNLITCHREGQRSYLSERKGSVVPFTSRQSDLSTYNGTYVRFIFAMLFLLNSVSYSQNVTPTISNTLRYGNGNRGAGNLSLPFSYFENLTDVRLNFQPAVTVGFRLLVDDPPEVGESFQGLRRRFVEFNQNNFSLRAGNFSELFGRGLALNLFENRTLAYDTWMDGVKARYSSPLVNATIVGGTIDFRDSVVVARFEKYKVRGANVEVQPIKQWTLGLSYVDVNGFIPQFVGNKSVTANIPEVYATINIDRWDGFAGFSRKWVNVVDDTATSVGNGVYASLSYSGDGIGVTFDYKDYRYDIRDPFGRIDNARATRLLPLQNPPTVQKEHTTTLLTRALHQVDFNDEVGIQAEGFYMLSPSTTFNINASAASRHHFYDYNKTLFTFTERKRNSSFLPSLNDRLSPYWELFAEVEHYFEEHSALRIGIARRANTLYNDFNGSAFNRVQQATTVPVQVQYRLAEDYSFIIQSELEWQYDSYSTNNEHFYNQLTTLTFTRSPDATISARYEITTNTSDPSGRKDWFVGEVGCTFGQSHTVTFSYGRERGGQVCSNGICQYQPPFSGGRFTLRSQL